MTSSFKFIMVIYIPPHKKSIAGIINDLSKSKKIHFIQIGANDGVRNDPLYKFIRRDNWKGILIEPQRNIFNRLKHNYKNAENLVFENVAICKEAGLKPLYKISFTDADWASAISSFRKKDVEALISSGYVDRNADKEGIKTPDKKKEYITTEEVTCFTFNEIVKKYNVKNIDILMIDAEGYDFEIIKTINFDKIKPYVIIYEHTHLTERDKCDCENFLKDIGYNLFTDSSDTLASLIKIEGL